jgi:acyl dehydratase
MSVRRLSSRPKLARMYAGAMTGIGAHRGCDLPDVTYELADVAIDRNHLARYNDVCGFRQADVLPLTYPHVLAFPLSVALMTQGTFPFRLPGLIHVANRITQHRAVRADERLTLRVHAANLREHPRGRQFDMVAEASVDGTTAWTSSGTYLHKQATNGNRAPKREPEAAPRPTAIWRVPASIGRRYAGVSGDVNPIHLHPLTARVFGFRRAIAHGMWVKARCLAAMEGRLPERVTAEVEFKAPLLVPSTVGFTAEALDAAWSIALFALRDGRRHLVGQIRDS